MTNQILELLIAERDKLNKAIEALQGTVKRRGRPPKALSLAVQAAASPVSASAAESATAKKARNFSQAQRRAAGERMKAMWAKKRASKK